MKKNLLLVLLPLLLVSIWFQHGGMLAGAEEGLPFYSAAKMWELSSSLWMPIETGLFAIDLYPRMPLAWVFLITTAFHIPPYIFQAVIYYFLMLTGILSVYYLTKQFVSGRTGDLIASVAAVFYLLNPYSMTQVWQRGLYAQFFMFALLPLTLYIFVRGLTQRKRHYIFYLALSSFVFSTAFGLVTNIIVYWSVLFFYGCYWVGTNRKLNTILWGGLYFFLSFLVWILVNAWWFIPLTIFKQDIFGGKAGDVVGNLGILTEVSRYFTFSSIIRLLQDYYFFSSGMYGALYTYSRFELISWILPGTIFLACIRITKQKNLLFFLLLFLLSLFFCLGPNAPFGAIFVFLFNHISLLQAFRNPFEKYGIVFMLAYAPLFGYGLYVLATIVKNILDRIIKIPYFFICLYVLLFTSGIYLWPMWKGLYKSAVAVPNEYAVVNDYIEQVEKDKTARLLVVPFEGEGLATTWNFSGLDPAIFTLKRPSLSYKFQTKYTYDISHSIYSYIGQVNEFPVFSLLNVKYLITRKDLQNEGDSQINAIGTIRDPQVSLTSEEFCRLLRQDTTVSCSIPRSIIDHYANKSHGVYFVVRFQTDIPAEISFILKNNNTFVYGWSDQGSSEYQTQSNITKEILLPLEAFSSPDTPFESVLVAQAKSLYPAHPPRITIENVRIVPFEIRSIDESKLVFTKGNLSVYRLKNNETQPLVTLLSNVKKALTFRDLFYLAQSDIQQISHTGYIIPIQNPDSSIDRYLYQGHKGSSTTVKISDTRYLVGVATKNSNVLAFNQTFSPQWKVVPISHDQNINNTLINNIRLLFLSYLPEEKHRVGNGYANFWLLPAGTKRYGIIFLPQIYSDVAWVFSTIGMTVVFGSLVVMIFRSKIR